MSAKVRDELESHPLADLFPTMTDAEFEELAQFDSGHASWDEPDFSILQHLPLAIAHAFRELAENAQKIGTLNISPDLLDRLLKTTT